jgi:hypothetical protein
MLPPSMRTIRLSFTKEITNDNTDKPREAHSIRRNFVRRKDFATTATSEEDEEETTDFHH